MKNIMCPYVDKLLHTVQRVEIVFDRYLKSSFESQTKESHGSGSRVNVTLNTDAEEIQQISCC